MKQQTIISRLGAVAAATMIGSGFTFAQTANEDAPNGTKVSASGWGVQCGNTDTGLQCAASMSLTAGEQNQRLLTITFRQLPDNDAPRLVLQLPFGLNLPRGIDLKVDERDPKKFAVDTCLQAGCFVFEPADDDLIAAMKAGDTLVVTMQTLEGAETAMSLSLTGFTAAIEKLQ